MARETSKASEAIVPHGIKPTTEIVSRRNSARCPAAA
jgi:hypothetical protein